MGLRLLWSSNAIWCKTGYGVQGQYLLPRFQALGHTVGLHAWYGLEGGMMELAQGMAMGGTELSAPVPVYPRAFDTYGNDIAQAHYHHFNADVIVSLIDVWVLREFGKKQMRWIPYMPIDMDPVPAPVLAALDGAYRVVTYARWGQKLLDGAGIPNICIPHGVDTKQFAPMDPLEARRKMGFGADDFVIGMVAANKGHPSRKAFPENLQAVALFKARHPKVKLRLYLHTLEGTQSGGIDVSALLNDLGFQKEEVRFCNQYSYMLGLSEEYMATAYNAMDVLLAATMSEGFGIPIVEAQACGTPVITTNFSSMPELTFGGYLVDVAQRFWTGLNSWIAVPSVESIAGGLEWAYAHRNSATLAEKARAGALDYDWDRVVELGWKPFLEEIERDIAKEPRPEAGRACPHDWLPTGVYNPDGTFSRACAKCDDELVTARNGTQIVIPRGLASPIPLDLEDDPQGGVAKIILREIRTAYRLDDLPFQPGDVVLDIGAHVGVVSCYLAKRHPEIRVIAFEPVPENYQRLLRNLKANGVTNVEAVNQAVTGDGRRLPLKGNLATNSGGSSAFVATGPDLCTVESVTLAQIAETFHLERVRLLKLDCEGAEHEIVRSLADLPLEIDDLVGEFHENAILRQQGFSVDASRAWCESRLGADHVRVTSQRLVP